MTVGTSGIQKGMDVYDVNGDKVGTVKDIVSAPAVGETGAATDTVDEAATGAGEMDAGQEPYIKVERGGILGIGAKELYLPFSAVQNVVSGDNVMISSTKEEVEDLYGNRPDFLGDED